MKILFICSNLIGDTILSTGAIKYFINQNKNAELSFVIGPTAAPLLKNLRNVKRVIIIKKRQFNLHWIDILRKIYFTKWDIVVDFRSSLISYFLNTKKKFIFKKLKKIHHIDQLNLTFGFNCSDLYVPTSIEEDRTALKKMNNNFKHIIIFPGGNWKPKLWSINNFNITIKSLASRYKKIKFILVGSLKEKNKFYNELIKDIHDEYIIDLFGVNLTQTSAYMKNSNLFIGNDSGLMHLAISQKLKVISLFGPTDDKVYGPYDHANVTIRTSESFDYFKSINIDDNISYMNSIKPEIVIENCIKLLNG